MSMRDVERHSFAAGRHLIGGPQISYCILKHPVEIIVAVSRVVVKWRQMPHAGQPGKLEGVLNAAMPKADPILIFLIGVLCVVDEEVHTFR